MDFTSIGYSLLGAQRRSYITNRMLMSFRIN